MKVTILGAGAFGTALGEILEKNRYEVVYFDPRISDKTIAELTVGADYLLLAVPSVVVAEVVNELPKNIPLIVATKGILTDKIFREFSDYMVLSGPGFTDDIKAGKETFLTATDQRIADMLAADYMKFDFTDDKLGVLMCGALKNVYALLAGVYNLEKYSPEWEKFIGEVAGEMKKILSTNGAKPETVDLACGIGDLRLTCALPSRNYEFGQILSHDKNAKPDKTVEGLTALDKIKRGEIVVPSDARHLVTLIEMSEGWA